MKKKRNPKIDDSQDKGTEAESQAGNHPDLIAKTTAETGVSPTSQVAGDETWATMFNGIPDLILLLDNDQRILRANPAMCRRLGMTENELIGRLCHEVVHDAAEPPEGCPFIASLRDRKERRSELSEGRLGGSFEVIVSPVFDEQGNRIGSVRTARDITRRKMEEDVLARAYEHLELQVEERTSELIEMNSQLRREIEKRASAQKAAYENEERFRAIFETARDCMFLKDESLRYVLVNPAMENLLQIPIWDIVGKTDAELFGKEVANHLKEGDLRVLGGEHIEEENTRTVKGAPLTFLDIRAPMRGRSGEVVGICGISHNITDRRLSAGQANPDYFESSSEVMRSTIEMAEIMARGDSVALLLGESGVGKDHLAKYIHNRSKRSSGAFFSINCATVALDLAESELFGHEPGAYTGARGRVRGLLELAEGGTLLLNEIADLPLPVQAKLLTFLDTRTFTRVGGRTAIRVSARIMAATNRDLQEAVEEGRFRVDLFHRLNVMTIRIPSLRERISDIPRLAEEILRELCAELRVSPVPKLEQEAIKRLMSYDWPGNVRELRNVLERSLIVGGGRISLPVSLAGGRNPEWEMITKFTEGRNLNEATNDLKRALIEEALRRSKGNKEKAARMLGISRFALHRQVRALDIGKV